MVCVKFYVIQYKFYIPYRFERKKLLGMSKTEIWFHLKINVSLTVQCRSAKFLQQVAMIQRVCFHLTFSKLSLMEEK